MRPFVFENPPLLQTEEGRILGEYLARQLLQVSQSFETVAEADLQYMRWLGEWSPGQQYLVNQVVLDSPWLMIANKTTYDRPAPQPSGDPAYTVPDVPAWTPGLDPGWVWTGNMYTMQESGWVEAVRVWIPTADTGRTHRLLILEWIDIPTNNYRILLNIVIPTSAFAVGWYTVQTDIIWLNGGQYEVAILSENIGDPALGFQGVWQYAGASQSGDPYWGGWNHNNQHNTIRFHEQQADGLGSAAPYLSNLGPGDTVTITTASATWTYDISSAPTINGQIYSYSCTRTLASGSISSGEACTVEWGTPGVAPDVEYVNLTGHWTTSQPAWASNVVGTIDREPDPGSGRTTSDDAHGADVLFQVGYVSPDWDFMSASPTS